MITVCNAIFFIVSKAGRAISHVINMDINNLLQILHMLHFNNAHNK